MSLKHKITPIHDWRMINRFSLYPQARVPDPSRLFLEVGLGFFVELTLEEALKVVERKTAALEDKATALTQDACKVKNI